MLVFLKLDNTIYRNRSVGIQPGIKMGPRTYRSNSQCTLLGELAYIGRYLRSLLCPFDGLI
jgi:hypothetical protein